MQEIQGRTGERNGMFSQPISRLYTHYQIHRAIRLLSDPRPDVRAATAVQLRGARALSAKPLRQVAFRKRSLTAVYAAELLVEMEDAQGLYALLAQYSDRYLSVWYGQYLRLVLARVGSERILHVLEAALDWMETSPLLREHWCLSLSVYALHALEALRAPIPLILWKRALSAYSPGFEDLRVCRTVVTTSETMGSVAAAHEDNWRVGSTLVAVRRVAVDALLTLNREGAFDLLREALAHSSPEVQITALYGLAHLRDSRAYVLLQPIAADRRHPLSRDARRVIESFGASQPDALTLVRAAIAHESAPEELLRPSAPRTDTDPDTMLRAVGSL